MRRVGIHGAGFVPISSMGACPSGAVSNGLLNNLIAYWPGNELNGNLLDLHTNALHLTDTNTVTSNPGLVYALARQYTGATFEYHRRLGDDALLSTGDVDFTLAAWVRHDTLAAAQQGIACKWGGAGNYEYSLMFAGTAWNRFKFSVSSNGTLVADVYANTLGIPAINTWYLLIGSHDSVANTISISANAGAVDSLAHATGVFDSAGQFMIGARNAGLFLDGRANPTMFWKSAAGGGGVLSAAKIASLYNGGLGLPYAAFTL